MSSFAPLRRTYSTLSSASQSSSHDIHSANLKEIVFKPCDLGPRITHRYSFIIHLLIFGLLELGFIALVSAALHRPIILHVSFTNTEVKGGITALAIAWHSLAVYVVKDVVLNVFSTEWLEQYDESKSFTLREMDIVSRLTTGLIDQARHCMSGRATLPFFLSFLSFLLLMLLNGLGPSAIGADLVSYKYSSITQVANLTWLPGNNGDNAIFSRTNAIVQLEVIQNATTVGFTSTQQDILIPWPSSNSLAENVSMKYESDVIRFNLTCSWKKPSLSGGEVGARWAPGNDYEVTGDLGTPFSANPSAVPIFPAEYVPNITILFLSSTVKPKRNQTLENSPFTSVPCHSLAYANMFRGWPGDCMPAFVSALVCNSQYEVLPASINATGSSLEATILSGAPTVKNIPPIAADYLFNTALLAAAVSSVVG